MRIAIIGAGVIGATIAWRLQRGGAEVVLVEATAPSSGTTGASFSWLTSFPQLSWREDPGRARLRRNLSATHRDLAEAIGGDWLDWSGTLTDLRAIPDAEAAIAGCREQGVGLEILDAHQLAEVAPGLDFGEDARVVHEPLSGWIDAPRLVERLIRALTELGGRVEIGSAVTGILERGGRIGGLMLANGQRIESDWVVNAAGSWGVHVAALAGFAFAMDLVPGVMIYAGVGLEGLPQLVVNGPGWLSRPERGYGLALHWRGQSLTPDHSGNGSDPAMMLADIAHSIPALRGAMPTDVRIGIRAIPQGGPVIGSLPWLPGFYMAVSHGGVGWAPTWAAVVERELLYAETVPELSGLRPARFYLEQQRIGRFADDAEQASAIRGMP